MHPNTTADLTAPLGHNEFMFSVKRNGHRRTADQRRVKAIGGYAACAKYAETLPSGTHTVICHDRFNRCFVFTVERTPVPNPPLTTTIDGDRA